MTCLLSGSAGKAVYGVSAACIYISNVDAEKHEQVDAKAVESLLCEVPR